MGEQGFPGLESENDKAEGLDTSDRFSCNAKYCAPKRPDVPVIGFSFTGILLTKGNGNTASSISVITKRQAFQLSPSTMKDTRSTE